MSFEVTEAMVQQYRSNIELVAQQKQSKLAPYVRREGIHAEYEYFDQIGPVEAQPKGGRHSDTPLMSTPHMRRRLTTHGYNWADMVDTADRLRMLADPTGPYTVNAVMAFNRAKDQVIIDALFGTAQAGKEGQTSVAFPNTQTITTNGAIGTTNPTDGLTIDKLLAARELMWKNEVIEDGMPLVCACSAVQLRELLNTTEIKNADYNTVRALAQGQVDTFMGFKFVRTEKLPFDGTYRECAIWHPTGLILGVAEDIRVKVSERPDKNYSQQVYVEMDLGAVRMEEVKVIKVRCKEV